MDRSKIVFPLADDKTISDDLVDDDERWMDCPVTCKEAALNDVSVKFADLGVRFPTFALSLLKSDCVCPPLFLLVDMMGDILVGSL